MEAIAKSIGWETVYPESLERIQWFVDTFREYYSEDIISDEDLEKYVVYNFGLYGQNMVYNIYITAKKSLDDDTLLDVFSEFVKTVKDELDLVHKLLDDIR